MANRKVTGTGKDSSGDITSLCGPWGTQSKHVAIIEIELGTHRYYTHAANGTEADIQVVDGATASISVPTPTRRPPTISQIFPTAEDPNRWGDVLKKRPLRESCPGVEPIEADLRLLLYMAP
jgi:hypothetical protein